MKAKYKVALGSIGLGLAFAATPALADCSSLPNFTSLKPAVTKAVGCARVAETKNEKVYGVYPADGITAAAFNRNRNLGMFQACRYRIEFTPRLCVRL